MRIGDYQLSGKVFLAPMAGVSDRPCRQISVSYGAALATTEMLISDSRHWHTQKSQTRLNFDHNPGLISVQIAGHDPLQMADAARQLAERGAQIIDINMGCPAKKVCGAASGSALLRDLGRVKSILNAVVQAVDIPVTLKTRTGWDSDQLTAVEVVQIADAAGIQALALHGRTRCQHFHGHAEHDTLKRLRDLTDLPLIANGDITMADQAETIVAATGCDGVMIGRAAQGNPWLIQQTHARLAGLAPPEAPPLDEVFQVASQHLTQLHEFYGEYQGVRFARKHLAWYWQSQAIQGTTAAFNRLDTAEEQLAWLAQSRQAA